MFDPDLHLLLDDSEIVTRIHLPRMTQTVRRESLEPVVQPDGKDEGTAIGYACCRRDAESGEYRLWYNSHRDLQYRLAVSRDGRTWKKQGFVFPDSTRARIDNLILVETAATVNEWFAGAKLVGAGYCNGFENENPAGLYLLRSMDGRNLELKTPGILPGVGDRSSLLYDDVNGEYLFFSRPGMSKLPGVKDGEPLRSRLAQLWKSRNLLDWDDCGVVLKPDDDDPPDTEIYGLQPFRCGRGFLGLLETYHREMERMDTQLIASDDGVAWRRVGDRKPVLPLGGEGAWDSHWTVPTFNPPIPDGDRLRVFYSGASTKHGSHSRHRRAIGLASMRREGWISLEAGRAEGVLVTNPLPLRKPMKLEVNVNCLTGFIKAEVIEAKGNCPNEPIPGHDGDASYVEFADAVRLPIRWGEKTVVEPVTAGACHLRFTMKQASLFSYRWTEA
ncbi:MAG: hypothetical protein JXA11_11395 [Phycisphaerae bacterium]|nr:hypothetical protein [Phycisphaerae bacterium]